MTMLLRKTEPMTMMKSPSGELKEVASKDIKTWNRAGWAETKNVKYRHNQMKARYPTPPNNKEENGQDRHRPHYT